jgi:pimeloyl-ACP methyl ester carboxylesterase
MQTRSNFYKYSILILAVGFSLLGNPFFINSNIIQQQASATDQSSEQMNTTRADRVRNILLVHGSWVDGSSWTKEIPILMDAGYNVTAVQLPLHSLADDVATVKRAVELVGGPTLLVGHSYGGFVITNAAYNNPNVTGLVYIAAFAPDEGESLGDFFDVTPLPEGPLIPDSGGFLYFNPDKFHEFVAQDVDPNEAEIMSAVQKPFHQSIAAEKSGPPAWKQLSAWYQISENDRMIPPDVQRMFAERVNATTISLDASHASLVSQPDEIAELILNATKG